MKISIIIPVYKVERYVRDCIESVLNQTYQNIEILVVDDASPDRSMHIVETIDSDKIRIFQHSENKGLSGARNTGIQHSTGDYLLFLDSDDTLAPEALERCAEMIAAHDSDVVSFNSLHINEEGDTWPLLWHSQFNHCDLYNISIDQYPKLIWDVAAWNKVIRRDLIEEIGLRFDEEQLWFEDHLFSLQLYTHTQKVTVLHEVLHFYLKRESSSSPSITQQKTFRSVEYRIRMMESVLHYLKISGNEHLKPLFFEPVLSFYNFILKDAYETKPDIESFYELLDRFRVIIRQANVSMYARYDFYIVEMALVVSYLPNEDVHSFYMHRNNPPILRKKLLQLHIPELKVFEAELDHTLSAKPYESPGVFSLKTAAFCLEASLFAIRSFFRHLLNLLKTPVKGFHVILDIYTLYFSGQFDRVHYEKQTRQTFRSVYAAIADYVMIGERRGFSPAHQFHAAHYKENNQDLEIWPYNLFAHYLRHGKSEGRQVFSFRTKDWL